MSLIFRLFSDSDQSLHLTANEVLYHAGQPAPQVYFVLKGRIAIRVNGQVVESVPAGSIVGEVAMLDNGLHGADAVAETDSVVEPVSIERFKFMVEETPYFAMDVMKAMAERMHQRLTGC